MTKIPFTADLLSRYSDFRKEFKDYDKEEEQKREELKGKPLISNASRTEDLAERIFEQPEERFKNKKLLLAQKLSSQNERMQGNHSAMNFMILSYLAPYHKVVSLLRRLSRTCFIMSFGSK